MSYIHKLLEIKHQTQINYTLKINVINHIYF